MSGAPGFGTRARLLGALTALVAVIGSPHGAGAQPLPRVAPESEGFSTERLARLDRFLQAEVDSGRVAGVVALVARRGNVVYEAAVGMADREAGTPMAANTIFRIASQTKALTSVAAMILVEEGRLSLNDRVSRYIPAYASTTVIALEDSAGSRVPRTSPARRPITVRDLLTQTAGISYGSDPLVRDRYRAAGLGPAAGEGWYFTDRTEPMCTAMETLATLPFVAQPGERFVYGYATDVLGCVVERASGTSLAEFVQRRITEPLGMRDTHFCVPVTDRTRLAAVYALDGNGMRRAEEGSHGQGHYVDGPCVAHGGGAGMVSTARDYARFLTMLAAGGMVDGVRILAPMSVALMTHDHLGDSYGRPGRGFGLGFEVIHDPARAGMYSAPGEFRWGGAYHTSYWVDPANDIVAVVLTQLLPATGSVLQDRARTLVYQALER